jgi:prepilin-type N-terminal cleavage/methylation domain-containing protein
MRRRAARPRRPGFTFVEVLVSIALIVLIMSILGEAFAQGLLVVRRAKGMGDLQDNLRTAVLPLRSDLQALHFDATEKLGTSFKQHTRPLAGFFRIQQGTATNEGSDQNSIPSNRVADDVLHLTVIKRGTRRASYLSALAPPATGTPATDPCVSLWTEGPAAYQSNWQTGGEYYMNSQRAEVMWFLVPMKEPDGWQMLAGSSNVPLYSLHRRHRLIVTDNDEALNTGPNRVPATSIPQLSEIAVRVDANDSTRAYFPTLRDFTDPLKRSMMDAAGARSEPSPLTGSHAGDDRVIGDVISFEVKLLMEGDHQFKTVWQIQQEARARFAGQTFPGGAGVYDTANWPINDPTDPGNTSGNTNNMTVTVKAVEVIIRVWDSKSEQTRQITVVQDL